MITNNFNKELRGISDALRDLGYTDSTIGLRQRYWKEYCFFHGSLDIDESSMDEFLLKNYDIQSGNINVSKRQYVLAEQVNQSARNVQRYIRLTELLPKLLDLVDERKLAFNSAVEVSYLNPEEQGWLAETIDSEQSTPSLSQAQRLKRFSQDGKLTEDMVLAIMSEQKKPETERVVLQSRQISQYFSPSATPKEMETSILSMLDTAKEWRSYFPEDSTLDDVNRRMRKVLEGMKRTKSRAPER